MKMIQQFIMLLQKNKTVFRSWYDCIMLRISFCGLLYLEYACYKRVQQARSVHN